MKKILVIGKNGYVSNCFKEYIGQFKNEYTAELITARDGLWKKCDFSQYEAIFNTVGLTHNDARAGTEDQFMKLNSELAYDLAYKAKKEGVKTFVHMSSMIVYGNMSGLGQRRIITEKTIPDPSDSIYGRSKLAGEERIKQLADENFSVAVIRSPLIYGIKAPDNVKRLIQFAQKFPVFPNLENHISMIYDENLCELVRLIIENHSNGIFYPQQETAISTSQFVKDIAQASGHKIWMTKIFNPALRILSHKVGFVGKAFGNQEYEIVLSNVFDGAYRKFTYQESIYKIALNNKDGAI